MLSAIACNNSSAEFKSVSTQEFSKYISSETVQLIDARTPDEFADGHIPSAINIDIKSDDFDTKILELDKSQPVAVYCRSGRRNKVAADRLVKAGFSVVELNNGILSWEGEIKK